MEQTNLKDERTDLEVKKKEYLEYYAGNNMKNLIKLCYPMITKIGGITQMDYDDLYSIALSVLHSSINSFDGRCKFSTYLISNINKKFKSYIRDKSAVKRNGKPEYTKEGKRLFNKNISLDEEISESGTTMGGMIQSDFNIDKATITEDIKTNGQADKYIGGLSELGQKVANMIIEGEYNLRRIKEKLNLPDKVFNKVMKEMREYENAKTLHKNIKVSKVEETDSKSIQKEETNMELKIGENSKDTSYPISVVLRKMHNSELRDDHPLQRSSEQWNALAKSELISDIIQGNIITPIIISEEFKDNIAQYWLIDGKQRCTIFDSYVNNGFAISKNVSVPIVKYIGKALDEEGNPTYNEDGFVNKAVCEFDIRGKRFKHLPEELQNNILDFAVPVMMNLNCSKYKIAYDIARFNRCRAMNRAQVGWTGMEEQFAELVDKILKLPMFKPNCTFTKYTEQNIKTGAMRRMIVETMMLSRFANDYKDDFAYMCKYLSENANDALFAEFYAMFDTMSAILIDKAAECFNMRDSLIWFALYDKFCEVGAEDKRFTDFLTEFLQSVHKTEYDEISKEHNRKSYTDVMIRYNFLLKHMMEFLGLEYETEIETVETKAETEAVKSVDTKDVVAVTDINESVESINDNADIIETFEETAVTDTNVDTVDTTDAVQELYDSDLVCTLSNEDKKFVVDELLQSFTDANEALVYADDANEWLLNVSDSDKINKYALPAVVMLVKYVGSIISDITKVDQYGINILRKFISNNRIENDVMSNYMNMIKYAAVA